MKDNTGQKAPLVRLRILLILLPIVALVALAYIYLRISEPIESTARPKIAVAKIPKDELIVELSKNYGSKKYSQHNEELYIRDFFKDKKGGTFVDVGANHYKINSTTYYLEKHLQWSGIAIDALEEFHQGYLKNRPKTEYFTFFVSDKSDQKKDFYVVEHNKRLSSGDQRVAKRHQVNTVEKVQTITLNDLLERLGIEHFDFLSMDIELAEPAALAGFDIRKYKPDLVCIEIHEPIEKELREYFLRHNYMEIKRYSNSDPLNSYFTPRMMNHTPQSAHETAKEAGSS